MRGSKKASAHLFGRGPFVCLWVKTLPAASDRNTTQIPLSKRGISAYVIEKSMAYWPQEWLDPGAYFSQEFLSLYLSAFISLCCLHSWIWSPLLVERWPPAAPSLPTSNLEVLSHLVLPAKIPSLVLISPFWINLYGQKEGSVAGWPVLSYMYSQGDWWWAQSHWNHKHWEKSIFPKELLLKEGRTDAEWVKTPECPTAWALCSQSS